MPRRAGDCAHLHTPKLIGTEIAVEARPDNLPLSAAVWDAANRYGRGSEAVALALYDALKQLESDAIAHSRG